jgi:hypothetical protein
VSSDSYKKVQEAICLAANKASRDPNSIKLVAVTKTVPWDLVEPLYLQGQRDFGESRVVDALEKMEEAPDDCRWHMIGTLQSNKVRKVIGKFVLIHSVDTSMIASRISDISKEMGVTTDVLLQVNTSGEESKHGLSPEQWLKQIDSTFSLPNIKIKGLMTMAPLVEDEKVVRDCFAGLRIFRDRLQEKIGQSLPELSMGMSHDFDWAIAEGATIVRIGTALWSPHSN